uniref:Saposin B-type domain-containing protein n=1 Tax=Trichuris muris TaxID=70415 RepID=A0A5S6QLA7_TRIMR
MMNKFIVLLLLFMAAEALVIKVEEEFGSELLNVIKQCGKCDHELFRYSQSHDHAEAIIHLKYLQYCLHAKCVPKVERK